ncbi:MAG: hypothetical protein ACD_78C00250G0003 [uncultured bacterium (gcode 4)]|uniref:Uncharacterized protein n=1 Tax=uncultured bacterium (gcode 4) TaxID=1234023 RepID=K1XX81_9BACT|nr:MAG: hypothetical protein ACD_78C00250G0003 [uncultured bacterium (gcode 4)]
MIHIESVFDIYPEQCFDNIGEYLSQSILIDNLARFFGNSEPIYLMETFMVRLIQLINPIYLTIRQKLYISCFF